MLIDAATFRQHYPMLAGTAEDTLLGDFIVRADSLLADWCGFPTNDDGTTSMAASSYDLLYDGPGTRQLGLLCLGVRPLVSVETVSVDGTVLAETTDYTIDYPGGRLGLVSGGALSSWPVGFQRIEIEFHAGYDPVPDALVAICAAEVRHLWDLRNTQGQSQFQSFGDSQTLTDRDALIPAAVQQALAAYKVCR